MNKITTRVEELEAALEPFVGIFGTYPADRFPDTEIVKISVTFGDLRQAARALAPQQTESGE